MNKATKVLFMHKRHTQHAHAIQFSDVHTSRTTHTQTALLVFNLQKVNREHFFTDAYANMWMCIKWMNDSILLTEFSLCRIYLFTNDLHNHFVSLFPGPCFTITIQFISPVFAVTIDIERYNGAPQNDLHGKKTRMAQHGTTKEAVFKLCCMFLTSQNKNPDPAWMIHCWSAAIRMSWWSLTSIAAGRYAWVVGTDGCTSHGATWWNRVGVFGRYIKNTFLFHRSGDTVDQKSDRTAWIAIVISVRPSAGDIFL